MDDYKKYKGYYVFKSTAWVLPILPIWLIKNTGIQVDGIIRYTGYFFIIAFVLEIPLGYLADKVGAKKSIALGTLFFMTAFLFLLLHQEPSGYFLYLLFMTLASPFFSGAEDALLLTLAPRGQALSSVKAELSALFYRSTIGMLILSVFFYSLSPSLPFYVQLSSLGVSFLFILIIKKDTPLVHHRLTIKGAPASLGGVFTPYILTLIFSSSFFGFLTNVNNRTIQLHFFDLLGGKSLYSIALFFVLGNIMSSLSAEWWKKQSFEDRRISLLLFSLYLLFSLSFFAMAQGSLIPTAIGFLLLSSLKTIYRPFLGALVLGFIKDSGSKATRLSAYTLLSSIGMALTSFLYADKFAGFDHQFNDRGGSPSFRGSSFLLFLLLSSFRAGGLSR